MGRWTLSPSRASTTWASCTAREVTRFFVMVNIDDELYGNSGDGGGGAPGQAECEFDEFCEIITRICNEKVRHRS